MLFRRLTDLHARYLILIPAIVTVAIFTAVLGLYNLWPPNNNLPSGTTPAGVRLIVSQTGINAIPIDELERSGLVATGPGNRYRLTRDGRPVPYLIDGRGPAARLYFYAQTITATAEAPAVYWLAVGEGPVVAQRDARSTAAGHAQGQRLAVWEENRIFLPQAQGEDNWLGALLFAPTSHSLPLDGITPTGGPALLTLRLWSHNQSPVHPDHHVLIRLNGRLVADHSWDGIREETITATISAGILRTDTNQLTIDVPGDTGAAGEALYLDWVRLAYQAELVMSNGQLTFASDAGTIQVVAGWDALVFDITRPEAPVRLTNLSTTGGRLRFAGAGPGSRYIIATPAAAHQPDLTVAPVWPRRLTDADNGADYIAILPEQPDFAAALQPLLDHRAEQGLAVTNVSLAQIYDEFSHGRPSPVAVREFLAHAAAHWRPAPRFVLLAGDASYDPQNFTSGKNEDLVPTRLIYTAHAGYVASDTWFSLLDQEMAPALAIGRFPAQTAEQLEIMVNKTLAYERGPGTHAGRALLVADDDPAFDQSSDQLADSLSRHGYMVEKLYMTRDDAVREKILGRLNDGVGLVNYVGHGGVQVWADEVIFQADDAFSLHNRDRLPIFTTFTCLNGYFNHPDIDALAETLLWTEAGGIVAAVAPSGRSYPRQQLPIARVFYQQLLSGEATTVGEALQRAKSAAANDADLYDVIHTFNLLGDPALRFRLAGGP